MGSSMSTLIFQPMLLCIAIAMIIIALTYQTKACDSVSKSSPDGVGAGNPWGSEIFKINMIMASIIVGSAVIINFISGLLL